jgi:hypothetical protein
LTLKNNKGETVFDLARLLTPFDFVHGILNLSLTDASKRSIDSVEYLIKGKANPNGRNLIEISLV